MEMGGIFFFQKFGVITPLQLGSGEYNWGFVCQMLVILTTIITQ